MSIVKELKTRIQLKYDSLANWNSNGGVVLKAGEIGICAIPSGGSAMGGDNTRPQILFKVGDGTSTFANLPWASAKAADVYDWAKQSALPIVRASSESGDAGNVIASISWNADTNKIEYTTASVATSEGMKQISDDLNLLEAAVAAMYTNAKIDELVADAKKAGTDAATELESYKTTNNAAVKKNADDIAAINHSTSGILAQAKAYTDGKDTAMNTRVQKLEAIDHSVYAKSADVVSNTTFEQFKTDNTAAIQAAKDYAKDYADGIKNSILGEGISETYDTLVEIQQWIEGPGVNATELTTAIADEAKARQEADTALQTNINKEATDRTAADSALSDRIDKIADGTTSVAKAEEATKATQDGNGNVIVNTYATKTELSDAVSNLEGYADQAEQDAKTYADGEISKEATARAAADTALGERIGAVEADYLNNVTVGTGLKVSNSPDVHGRLVDIDESVVFVFNCGTSNTLVD